MQADGQALRRILTETSSPLIVAGVQDALSALIAEKAGFRAVWASSFGVSAAAGLPDLNLLSMTEVLDAIRRIRGAITIPLIADCDSGYGNELNAFRMAREFFRCGLSVLCIEDSPFPKRCSLYSGSGRRLEPMEGHAARLRALREGATEEAFIIARTEALVAETGIQDALERAHAYVNAGADAILVQTKSTDGHDMMLFGQLWHNKSVPLIAVPTTYSVSFTDLFAVGYRVIILANQLLRASINSMEMVAGALVFSERSDAVRHQISPLERVYELLKVKEVDQMQNNFHSLSAPNTPDAMSNEVSARTQTRNGPCVETQEAHLDEVVA